MGYNKEAAMKRNIAFMSDESQTGVLIRVDEFGPIELPKSAPLESFDLPREIKRFCDQTIERHLRFAQQHKQFDDDWIPALKPYLGIAEHSCFMGGSVSYGGNTSYHHQAIDDILDWESLKIDRNTPHYTALLDGMAYLKEKSKTYDFYAALRGGDGPMDIANAVRGNDILYDFYDEPEATSALIDFCATGAEWTFENQYPLASEVGGGYISGMTTWMPGHAIGHLSEDASCLCSPALYEEFGLPYTRKLLEKFDYAMMHVHSLGRACIPLISSMEKIRTFQLSSDPNQPHAMDVYRQFANELQGRTIMLDLTPQQMVDNADFLKGRRTIINLLASNPDEARRAIDFARSI